MGVPRHVGNKGKYRTIRLCDDYRKLNAITEHDVYLFPRLHDAPVRVHAADYFTTIDQLSGSWEVPMDTNDAEMTAFPTLDGLYKYNRLPFVLTNAPAILQRLIEIILGTIGGP